MVRLILEITAIALVGSLGVPVLMAILAKMGLFEPFSVRVLGRRLWFGKAPPK